MEEILKVIYNFSSPVVYSFLIVATIFLLIYYFYKYLLIPTIVKVNKEKETLELQHARMMALFAELDPDPLIRIDSKGKIIQTNEAAKKVFGDLLLNEKNITDVLLINETHIKESITKNISLTLTEKIANKHYTVLLRGEPNLNIAQVYFRDITDRKKYEEMLIKSEKRLRQLSEHTSELIEEERQRIARELHDGIGQNLSFLRLKMLSLLETKNNFNNVKHINQLIELLENSITELKEISYKLKPRVIEEMGLNLAIEHLVEKVTRESNIKGSFNVSGLSKRLDYNLEIYIYRIIQEALSNIIKHSQATEFNIQITFEKNLIRIMTSDNGKGFDVDKVLNNNGRLKGMGLINIQERIKNYGGKFKVDSQLEKGTVLIIEIPVKQTKRWKTKVK